MWLNDVLFTVVSLVCHKDGYDETHLNPEATEYDKL